MKRTLPIVPAVILFVMIAAAAGGTARADDSRFKNYAIVDLGFYQPVDDLDESGFDTGMNFSAAYGRYIAKNLIFEAGFGFFYTDRDFLGNAPIAGNYTQEDSIGIAPITLSLKGAFTAGNAEFYGGGGIGGYLLVFNSDITASNLGSFSVDDDDVALGAHVLAGVNFNITERFFIGVDGRYIWTDTVTINKRVADIPIEYSGDLNGFTVNLAVGFRF
jgi:opacity protein-like surface antigen